jgi:hypothetical protein
MIWNVHADQVDHNKLWCLCLPNTCLQQNELVHFQLFRWRMLMGLELVSQSEVKRYENLQHTIYRRQEVLIFL